MKNLSTLLVGMTGTGKSTVVRVLLQHTARAIVCDVQCEYSDIPRAIVVYDLEEAFSEFMRVRWDAFVLVAQFEEPDDYLALMELAEHTQKVEPHGPLVIVWEEASTHSDTSHIPEIIKTLFNKGRHRRISMLTVIQVDTEIHRVTRQNSPVIVTLKQNQLSGNFHSKFDETAVQQLVSLRDEYTPEPKQGRHFLVYPEGINLYEIWADYHDYIVRRPKKSVVAPAVGSRPATENVGPERSPEEAAGVE